MAMQTCSAHGKPKTHHCFVCHKPLCGECPGRDGCCSEKCQQSRLKFGARPTVAARPGQGPVPLIMTLLKVGAVVAVLYFGGKKLGVQDYLPPSLGGPEPSTSSDEDE